MEFILFLSPKMAQQLGGDMPFNLFETPVISPHVIVLTLMVQTAAKVVIHKQSSISMFLWNYRYPSTIFLCPKVRTLVQSKREGLQREESASQSLFWEDTHVGFLSLAIWV